MRRRATRSSCAAAPLALSAALGIGLHAASPAAASARAPARILRAARAPPARRLTFVRPAAQLAGTSAYDPAVPLALLRLYLVFPERAAARSVQRALLKALLALPEADFWLLLHLVPERLQQDEGVAALSALATALEAGRFREFWAAAAAPAAAALLATAPGFEAAARAFVLCSLGAVYRAMPAAQLAEALRLERPALEAWLKASAEGWALEGDTAAAPRCEANDPQPCVGAESIPFAKLEGLFKAVKA